MPHIPEENNPHHSSQSSSNEPVSGAPAHASTGTPSASDQAAAGAHEALAGAQSNLSDTSHAVSGAATALGNLASGDGNIVDAALAVKGAIDSVKGLSGAISASVMMPILKALAAFKGVAVLPAGKQMDPVIGIDVHMVTIPPSPAPVPMPHPYVGTLFYPKDWVSCLLNTLKPAALAVAPDAAEGDTGIGASLAKNKAAIASLVMGLANMSASVKFGGFVPRAVTGTATKNVPHIPMGAGFHPAFAAAVKKNVGKAFLGSFFVVADGDPMVGCFHLNYDCWDVGVVDLFKMQRGGAKKHPPEAETQVELFVPSGTVMAIPWGKPVLVNSIPTPINPLAIADKLFKAGLGKLAGALRKVMEKVINALKKTTLGKKLGCDHWTAVSKAVGTGQSHPVDVSGGYFYTDNVDFKLPGPIPFVWERTWQSFSTYKGPLGYGWHHSYDLAINFDKEANIAVMRMADGRPVDFEIPVIGKPTYNRAEKLTLNIHEEGYYFVTDKKGLIYRFTQKFYNNKFSNTEGYLLQSVANRNGFAILFDYDSNGELTQITDSAARILIVKNDGKGHILSIHAPHPSGDDKTFAITSYTYTLEGDMESQADALKQAMFFYYKNHQMVKEVWRNGCVWQFKYDKPDGKDAKCIEVWGTGDILHYKFDYTDPQCTVVTNSRGYKKLFYHKNGVVIKHVDALGAEWEYRYNAHNELEWETDPLGNQKATTYDAIGNVETITEANGSFVQITYGGGLLKHFTSEYIDRAGGKWKWDYDAAGNLIKRTNPLKAETKYQYVDGFLKTITNAKGVKTQLEYDASYNLIKVIASNGYEMEWSYDILGNTIRSIDSLGNTRRIQFNLLTQPEVIHEPDGNIRYLKFDAEANVIQAKDKHYNIGFNYDFLNHLISRSQAGHSVNYKYDTEGNLVELINEHSEVYSFEIDAADRVIKEIGFDGLTRRYIRNTAGKVTQVERPGNKFTKYNYNEVGNITEVIYHDATFEKYVYANDGLLIEAGNTNSKIGLERDILGRITKETNAENFINYQYDLFGNRTNIESSLGANIQNEFDDFGNVINTKANEWQSNTNYNELGLEIECLLPGNISCQWTRDKLGRPTKQNIRNEKSSLHNRSYTWDVNYRLQKIADSNTGVTQFTHDEIGNLAKTIFSDGTEQLRNPDAVGNLFNSPDRTDRDYGKGGKLLKANGIHYKYDDEGNLTEKKEASGKTWRYQWNANGMLQSVLRPDGEAVEFTYDALGRRLSKQFKSTITKWLWDGNKPLHEWKEHTRTGEKLSNTSVGEDGIITWLFNEKNFAPVAKLRAEKSYSILTDHLGTPYQMYNEQGEKLWEMHLDSYGNKRAYKGDEGSCPFRYQGQYEDVETGLYYNRFRYYDVTDGRYICQDPIGLNSNQLNFYFYVKDINNFIDPFGLACLKGKEADKAAEALGYERIKEKSHGQPVYKKGRSYITPDVDDHSGGVWKKADSVKNLGKKNTREGTYNEKLERIGD